jgi:hypothetical protein
VTNADEAWIEKTCSGYYDSAVTRIDLVLNEEGNAAGLIVKEPNCTYRILAVNECGESYSECCECSSPAPTIDFEIFGLTGIMAALNGMYSVSPGDVGIVATTGAALHEMNCAGPGFLTNKAAGSVHVEYGADLLVITVEKQEIDSAVRGTIEQTLFVINFDPLNECPTPQISSCKVTLTREDRIDSSPLLCFPKPSEAQILWS